MIDYSNYVFDGVFDYITRALVAKNAMTEELSLVLDDIYCDYVNEYYRKNKSNNLKKGD